ncbi:hypothetical protein EXIGLDRAFT_838813 [Exidia glandulosa HHB12029]|uniref:Uncharacterized protein n=1 Tax=Exidia glandulosa HHB12029 TaxID=1314781 RepID=A0A165FHT9_EXIGL|nr:hypothetical protein EXIGLDRAFT_838813 [Exidia glandulosa HHB12029]
MDNSKFPDELIKEMLSPPLLVPDALFADTGPVSPFAKATSSASDVLLVCKRWMRVGTPALYETVIIRSTAQAQALEMALTRNPEFGRFVKKLRLEGVYGEYITSKIIATMTRVTDFCFTLSIYSADKLAGMTKALDMFEPKRIVLTLNDPKRRNSQNRTLIKKLTAHVKASEKLEYFSFPRLGNHGVYNEFTDERDLASALVDCSSLLTVEAQPRVYSYNPSATRNAVVALLEKKPARKIILLISSPYYGYDGSLNYEASFKKDLPVGLASRVIFRDPKGSSSAAAISAPEDSSTATVSNPFFIPMSNASPEVRAKVWSRVLSFAVEKPTPVSSLTMHWYQPRGSTWFDYNRFDYQMAGSLLHVSRAFYQALIPVLFRHLRFDRASTFRTCERLLKSFDDAVSLGLLVETLDLCWSDGSFDVRPDDDDTPSHAVDVESVLSQLTNVQTALFSGIRPSTYANLSSFGSSVRTLHLQGFAHGCFFAVSWATPISLDVFTEFNALKELDIDQEHVKFVVGSNTDVFPSLEVLKVHRVHGSFFTSLAKTSLPNLKRFEISVGFKKSETFIKQRGKTITTLVTTTGFDQSTFNSMPSLQTLDLFDEVQPMALNKLNHDKLERLSLHWDTSRGKWLDRYKVTTSILSTKNFPALKEVMVSQKREIWPSTERDIKKSPWPEMAVTLAEKNITLLDHTGRSWRPRLQLQQQQ